MFGKLPEEAKHQFHDQLGISEENDFQVVRPWFRGGAETYVMQFRTTNENTGVSVDLIAKACIKIPCAEVMQDWLRRRETLTTAGVVVPFPYGLSDRATLVEEFAPLTLKEAYSFADDVGRLVLAQEFSRTYGLVMEQGFRPLSWHDTRSHGDDVVLIDFGEDLGGQSNIAAPDPTKLAADATRTFERLVR